jgi:glycosyltransferase involved in cell wall biosynthesis
MKIYFLSYWFPYPPDNGSRILEINFIKALSVEHEVYLTTFLQDDSDPGNVETLSRFCKVVSLHSPKPPQKSSRSYLGLFSKRPRSVVDNFDPDIYDAIQKTILKINPDVIVVSMVDIAEYITFGNSDVPSILIDHNCEFGVIQRKAEFATSLLAKLRYEMSWRKYARWEASILREFDKVVMPTKEDSLKMEQFSPGVRNIHVIPNAADTDHFDPSKWSPDDNILVYNGALSYSANLDSVLYYKEKIYPHLKKIYPNIKLLVTGRYDNVNIDLISDCPGLSSQVL